MNATKTDSFGADTRTKCGFCRKVHPTRVAAVACYDSHARKVIAADDCRNISDLLWGEHFARQSSPKEPSNA